MAAAFQKRHEAIRWNPAARKPGPAAGLNPLPRRLTGRRGGRLCLSLAEGQAAPISHLLRL